MMEDCASQLAFHLQGPEEFGLVNDFLNLFGIESRLDMFVLLPLLPFARGESSEYRDSDRRSFQLSEVERHSFQTTAVY
jgi:hypothetical protein